MNSLEFSIPYNGRPESLPLIFALNRLGRNRVREVYLAGPQEYSASGRVMPRITLDEFIDVINQIHAEGIRVNLLLNSVCEGSHWYDADVVQSRIDYVGLLHRKHGVEAVTIANPVYIKAIRAHFPEIEIAVSVLGGVDSVQRAIYFDDMGVDVIVPDTSVNRDLALLRQIKGSIRARLKLIPNQGCVYRCPFQRFHGPYIAHKSVDDVPARHDRGEETPFFQQRCSEMITDRPYLIFQSAWLRPEDIQRCGDITNFFKISGRRNAKWAQISRAYLEESWDGDLLELMDGPLKFFGRNHAVCVNNKELGLYNPFDRLTSCDKDCDACGYCQALAPRLISRRTDQRQASVR